MNDSGIQMVAVQSGLVLITVLGIYVVMLIFRLRRSLRRLLPDAPPARIDIQQVDTKPWETRPAPATADGPPAPEDNAASSGTPFQRQETTRIP